MISKNKNINLKVKNYSTKLNVYSYNYILFNIPVDVLMKSDPAIIAVIATLYKVSLESNSATDKIVFNATFSLTHKHFIARKSWYSSSKLPPMANPRSMTRSISAAPCEIAYSTSVIRQLNGTWPIGKPPATNIGDQIKNNM